MFSRLKRGLTTYFSPDVAKEIQPESYAETGGSNKALFNPTKNNRQTIEKYLTIYEQGGMISEAIDLYSHVQQRVPVGRRPERDWCL